MRDELYRAYSGLTAAQVAEQTRRGLVNIKTETGTRSVKEIFKSNILTYFNLVFVILAILLIIGRSYRDLSFLLIIVANSAIGILQELRAKSVLDKMNLMAEPFLTVIRDGNEMQIRSRELVQGDFVILSSGTQIPADCKVIAGGMSVNESILTGESDEVRKERGDRLLGGSFVVNGECLAVAEAVGEATFAAGLTKEATSMDGKEHSEILQSLDKMLKFFGILIIPLGIILFIEQFGFGDLGFSPSISATVAALIGMIPEGIYLTASVALVVSAMKLASKQVLVHDLKCIETLARVDILCVDKTGTITEKDMKVSGYKSLHKALSSDGVFALLSDFAASVRDVNDTMAAIKEFFTKPTGKLSESSCPFSSKYKYSAEQINGHAYVLGAPEYVLASRISLYQEDILKYSEQGYRVLALAQYPYLPQGEDLTLGPQEKILPLGLVALENPVRKGAVETFSYFNQQGVEIKVISGDNPLTVSRVAARAGVRNAGQYVDASTLQSPQDIMKASGKYTVFGRVSPEQKKQLVMALQRRGNRVAMTGDGVNDIIAMKQSDCSVAMASGSEAAAQAAQLVLLDSDFSRMPAIVDEGRRVVNNLTQAASLYLVKNIFSLLLAVFSVILMFNYPLNPAQITLISLFTIGIPSFVLALEPNTDPIEGSFMKNVIMKALPAGITDFLIISALVIFARQFSLDADSLSTACSVILAVVGFMILYLIIRPMKKQHVIMFVLLFAGWIICMAFFPSVFGITAVSRSCLMLLIVFTITTDPILRYLTRLFRWGRKMFSKWKDRNE